MAAPTHTNTTVGSAGSATTNRPTGTLGLLVFVGAIYDDTTVISGDATSPAGSWTLQQHIAFTGAHDGTDGPIAMWMWTKPGEAGDAATFTWSETTSGTYFVSFCSRYNHGSGTPLVNAVATPTQGRSTTSAVPAVTTTVDECLIVASKIGYNDAVTSSPPSPFSQRAIDGDGVSYMWERAAATIGTYGPTAYSMATQDTFTNVAIAISPPAGGATPGPVRRRRSPQYLRMR